MDNETAETALTVDKLACSLLGAFDSVVDTIKVSWNGGVSSQGERRCKNLVLFLNPPPQQVFDQQRNIALQFRTPELEAETNGDHSRQHAFYQLVI